MPRKPDPGDQAAKWAVAAFFQAPLWVRAALVVAAAVAALVYYVVEHRRDFGPPPAAPPTAPDGSAEYLFCWWNVENLFDDHDDRRRAPDGEYDRAFAEDTGLLQEKYDHLSTALLRLNGGRGPDILACAEVETPRAADLLRDALNGKVADPALKYTAVAMKDLDAGRHIAPAVISRVPLDESRTRLHGSRLRILETSLRVNGHDLHLIASHWTSQLGRNGGHGEAGRDKYADALADLVAGALGRDPAADLLVCGDFNDTPDSEPVSGRLHATADRAAVRAGADPPRLLDLLAGKPADQFGTIYFHGPLIYDHICVSAGLLDGAGWGCDPDSVRTERDGLTRRGVRTEPWRFGNPRGAPTGGRGYSDHFPVTVRLSVRPPAR